MEQYTNNIFMSPVLIQIPTIAETMVIAKLFILNEQSAIREIAL